MVCPGGSLVPSGKSDQSESLRLRATTNDTAVGFGGMMTPPPLDVETLALHVLAHMHLPSSSKTTTTTGLNTLVKYLRGETSSSQNQNHHHQPRRRHHHHHHPPPQVTLVPPKVLFIIDGCDGLLVRQQGTDGGGTSVKASSGPGGGNPGTTGSQGGLRTPRPRTPPSAAREASHTPLHDTISSPPHTPCDVQRVSSDLSQLSLTPPPTSSSRSSSNSLDSANKLSTNITATASSAFCELIEGIMGQSQSTRYLIRI